MIMSENKKTDTISSVPIKKEEQPTSSAGSLKRFGDNPNKMIIGSGSNFKGTDIKTDEIEVYGKIETNIHAKNIYVGSVAEIIGCVTCEKAEIHGSVHGAIQVNGKLRASIEIDKNIDKEELIEMCKNHSNVIKFISDKEIIREIYVPNKIVNIVIK